MSTAAPRAARWALVVSLAVMAACSVRKSEPSAASPSGAEASVALAPTALTLADVPTAPNVRSAPPRAQRRPGPLDVTFAVVSDTHLGHPGNEEKNRALVASLGTLPGRRYPGRKDAIVSDVRGLLVAGDLTEWGDVGEWEAFRSVYDLGGGERPGSPFPLFEIVGNHDMVHGPWLAAEVAKRHPGRNAYSWDWDDVHLVGLGEAPEDLSLDALERDLANTAVDRPLVLLFHRPLAGPWIEDRPTPAQKARLRQLVRGREVLGIFHGHHHARAHYVWEGLDVWKPGAVKDGAPELAVVHVEETRLTVATFNWHSRAFVDVFTRARSRAAGR